MNDEQIIELFWNRDETAITRTAEQYGSYCYSIAYRILHSKEDSEESVNDTYLQVWTAIPPKRPARFSVFLGKITRNISINRYRSRTTQKRGAGEYALALEELDHCLGGGTDPEQELFQEELKSYIDEFLSSLSMQERRVFIQRYWRFYSIREIAEQFGYSVAKTRSMLFHTRKKLKSYLTKRGVLE